MNSSQPCLTELNTLNNSQNSGNGSMNNPVTSGFFAGNGKATENQLLTRLKEMSELNAHLENLVGVKSMELTEVVATNARFLSILAHDLKSPFSSIIGVLEILKESYAEFDAQKIEQYLNIATNSVSRTLTLLDNLLAWTVSQNKAKNFNPVKVNLCDLISNEIEMVSASAFQKNIGICHIIPADLNVTADIQMVKTILRNLIGNAIKFSHPGGKIILSAVEIKAFVEITVADQGVGMTKKVRDRLFNSNNLFSSKGTDNEHGTGLGLLICREFVEMHGGILRIESNSGTGSRFIFTLPLSA